VRPARSGTEWSVDVPRLGAVLSFANRTVRCPPGQSPAAANPDEIVTKVDICHRTNSNQNPYVVNAPDASGDVSGHDGHDGPVWDDSLKENHIKWGDIIPPFKYSGGTYPGQNWDATGKAIYENDCVPPDPPEEQLFGQLQIAKVVTGTEGVPADFTIHVDCDDKARDDVTIHPGAPAVFSDIEAGSTCVITELGTGGFPSGTTVSYSPPTANTTGVLVEANQHVDVTVTNAFPTASGPTPPGPTVAAEAVSVTPRFTGPSGLRALTTPGATRGS